MQRAVLLARAHPDRAPGVVIDVTVDRSIPSIDGDEDLLHRAIFNLLLNAIQAVGATGTVRVEVAWQRPEEAAASATVITGDLIAISVSDDGPGIPAELRHRLFEPFVTGRPGGTGLGLPVVHRAVEAHRGIVLVTSLTPGTRFTLVLPVARGSQLATSEAAASAVEVAA